VNTLKEAQIMFTRLTRLLFVMALAIPAMANEQNTDNQLAEQVAHGVRMYSHYDVFDWVEGSVHDGVVTLTGAVREPFHKDDYARIVQSIPGVKSLDNQLRVLPVSMVDDQIRRAASRAIFRDPMFTGYAIQANPPIHIVVENGKITLKGVVANPMDRQIVESRVRTNVLAFDVTNDLKVEERG
jgi:osmotically-inducible protein OsmY